MGNRTSSTKLIKIANPHLKIHYCVQNGLIHTLCNWWCWVDLLQQYDSSAIWTEPDTSIKLGKPPPHQLKFLECFVTYDKHFHCELLQEDFPWFRMSLLMAPLEPNSNITNCPIIIRSSKPHEVNKIKSTRNMCETNQKWITRDQPWLVLLFRPALGLISRI